MRLIYCLLLILILILILILALAAALASASGRLLTLAHQGKLPLLGLVARREQVLDRLLAEHHLATAYNASVLV